MAWVFEGVLLPDGEGGRVGVGSGDEESLPGRFALRGLVDAHCHLTVAVDAQGPYLDGSLAEPRLHELAQQGVTGVRDVGGDSSVTLDLARGTVAGRPRLQAAGRFLAPEGRYFPRMRVPVPAEELVEAVVAEIDRGASWVKIIADFPVVDGDARLDFGTNAPTYELDVVAAAVGAAHERGVRVAAHCNDPIVEDLVEMGIDSIEHGLSLTDTAVRELGRRGGAWTPTLAAVYAVTNGDPQRRAEAVEHFRTMLPAALAAGVTVMTGSDAAGTVDQEVALLVELGLTPEQALTAATTAAQAYLGLAPADDLVTYEADPRSDPEVLKTPSAVVVGGLRVR